MDQVLEFFRKLFDTSDWPPRWHCGNWTDFHGWLYIISDLLIWSAYFAIPLAILRYVTKRSDARFVRGYFLFAAFILACGSTHLLDAVTFWFPAYRLNALVRFVTGVVSWVTVFYLIRILPMASSLRSYAELEKEINEREKVEEELKHVNNKLVAAQEIAKVGSWEWDIASNKLTWSKELFKIYGIAPHANALTYEDFIHRVHPEDRDFVSESIKSGFLSKRFAPFVHRIVLESGEVKVLSARGEIVLNEEGNIIRMIGTGQDITEQQKAQQQVVERTHELELRNAELQKFAYVASHDLQEPLRKILTFSSLLDRHIDKSNEKVSMYMEKITQASGRMQNLIDDILQFSSINTSPVSFTSLDLNEVIAQVLSDLEVQVEASGAQITCDRLPVIEGVPTQLGQLFQNLLSNAIKFRKEDVQSTVFVTSTVLTGAQLQADEKGMDLSPLSNVMYWEREKFVRIRIQDNGIGFDPAYADKIFEIFQRLHSRSYSGTGIGLAICKKIVDNHHGVIQARGTQGEGAQFTVILPLSQKKYLATPSSLTADEKMMLN